MLQQFRGSIIFTLVCLVLAALVGWLRTHTLAGLFEVLWVVIVLAVLEISLSFDNAVVNAAVLEKMTPVWQKRFLTWGMVIAVFGMRIVFPLGIVAIAAGIGPVEALRLSLEQPQEYEKIVSGAHIGIAGFGGAFLAMVGLKFFFDSDKDVHWIGLVERFLSRFSSISALEMALVLLAVLGVASLLPQDVAMRFVIAAIFGLVSFVVVDGIGTMLESKEAATRAVAGEVARAGLGGFIYLNVLDASFSFDGVIGAFALSNNMLVIALGLSIGAMFVRSMTIMMVEKGTLGEYRYLEHGAFWAIIVLGGIMLASARFEISETVTGLIGGVLIALSLAWSVRYKRREG
ncbi:DUF475 domain-containing protein [Novosphingobium lentum]|uniref:DUF475 domain-containing protein n=1 Tax=Novosphingobium lentum TaxID=145287 RepID=UPI000831BF60|nr:DUF475 domain-containing protein [Novosphingobium lentum]